MHLPATIAALCFLPAAFGQTGATSRQAPPKSSVKAVTPGKKAAAKKAAGKQAVRRPFVQQQPTVERYREIQQALADKGYFGGPLDGAWGPESVDALKRFQKEQNLEPDGKIGALSLMALGLGTQPRPAASAQAADIAVDPPPVAQPRP